jgi:two-component system sensor histidine kinase QseC
MPLRTLRGRLSLGMVAVFSAALGVSALLDAWQARHPGRAAVRDILPEPYQDALVLAGFTVPALVLIWLVSSWSLRPLDRASRQARAIGPAVPAARITADGLPAEITPLVDAVNGALDRMAEAAAAERRFTENAAHELRTPLAVLSLRLQRARAAESATPDWAAIERDLAHINRLVARLLDLARADHAGRSASPGTLPVVNLARLAREAAAGILPLAEAAGRKVLLDLPETLAVPGEADDLREALSALLENAAVHGAGTISVSAATAGGRMILRVQDDGPGIPPGQEAAVFERFQKGSASEGSGLGLAIVREIIRRHDGTARVVPGAGCRMEIDLPAA